MADEREYAYEYTGPERRAVDELARERANDALKAIAKHEKECAARWAKVEVLLGEVMRKFVYGALGLMAMFATLWARTQGWI